MKYKLGAIVNRQLKDKRNYSSNELALTSFVNWTDIDREHTRHYNVYNQGQVGSCVANSIAKISEIQHLAESGIHIKFDPNYIYTQRSNTTAGMGVNDACKIAQSGCCPLIFGVSEPTKELEALPKYYLDYYSKEMEFSSQTFSLGKYFWLHNDIEEIANAIETYGSVMVWFGFGRNNKWWSEKPIVANNTKPYHHSVVAVDYGIEDGKRCLIIEDSSGPETGFNGNQRIITEDFLKANCYVAIAFAWNTHEQLTHYAPFTYDLEYTMRSEEVRRLQVILQMIGCFPDSVDATGYYGTITKQAVLKFQLEWEVIDNEDSSGAGRLGPLSREMLNEVISSYEN